MANAVEIVITATDKASGVIKGTTGGLSGLGNAFKSLTGFSLGGAAALTAVTGALKFSITAAADAERVMALTEAVIKSTGGAAGFTATQIAGLSLEHSRLTGIEDEVTQSGNNMLLTFTAIGKDIFPRASMAMQDMAVAMNGGNLAGVDLKSTAILIGKALNVVEGDTAGATRAMSALQRVGVRFTDDQKKMGAELVKNGKVIEYQSLILGELETEFGGAAAAAGDTFAGQAEKLKNELGNLGEVVGGALIPSLTDLLSWMNQNLIQMQEFSDILADHRAGVIDTSGTYEEYIAKQDELRGMAGRAQAGIEDLTEAEFLERQEVDNMIDPRRESIEALENATTATDDYTEATDTATLSLIKFNDAAIAKEAIDALNDALKAGVITQGEYDVAWRDIMLSYGQANDASVQFTIEARALHQALADGKITAGEYKAALQALEKKWNVEVTSTFTQVNKVINQVASQVGAAQIGATTTRGTGGRQHGGPVMAGQMYLVGEAGPELFIPGQGGQIIPNNQINNYFNLTMHSNAAQERVVEDFNMMRAMASI